MRRRFHHGNETRRGRPTSWSSSSRLSGPGARFRHGPAILSSSPRQHPRGAAIMLVAVGSCAHGCQPQDAFAPLFSDAGDHPAGALRAAPRAGLGRGAGGFGSCSGSASVSTCSGPSWASRASPPSPTDCAICRCPRPTHLLRGAAADHDLRGALAGGADRPGEVDRHRGGIRRHAGGAPAQRARNLHPRRAGHPGHRAHLCPFGDRGAGPGPDRLDPEHGVLADGDGGGRRRLPWPWLAGGRSSRRTGFRSRRWPSPAHWPNGVSPRPSGWARRPSSPRWNTPRWSGE